MPSGPKPYGGETRLLHIARKVVVGNDCWEWTGPHRTDGYGHFSERVNGRKVWIRAHRAMYEIMRGPIPEGLVIDHLCRNRGCVRPKHMELVTDNENKLRGISPPASNRRKTHCPAGHEYTPDNTRVWKSYRTCRQCAKAKKSTSYQRITMAIRLMLDGVVEPEKPVLQKLPRPKATHCKSGHAYTAENTAIKQGYRHCLACDEAWRRRRAKHAA